MTATEWFTRVTRIFLLRPGSVINPLLQVHTRSFRSQSLPQTSCICNAEAAKPFSTNQRIAFANPQLPMSRKCPHSPRIIFESFRLARALHERRAPHTRRPCRHNQDKSTSLRVLKSNTQPTNQFADRAIEAFRLSLASYYYATE